MAIPAGGGQLLPSEPCRGRGRRREAGSPRQGVRQFPRCPPAWGPGTKPANGACRKMWFVCVLKQFKRCFPLQEMKILKAEMFGPGMGRRRGE